MVSGVTHIYGLKYVGNLTANFGIAGDKVEDTFWRAEKLVLPINIEYAVAICGTNNIDF